MLVEERRQKLSGIVNQRGYVPLPELVAAMGVSESTVRRDLDFLHEQGLLRRTHGGAIAHEEPALLPPFEELSGRQTREKHAIAREVARRVADGETILLDGGTTTYQVARQLIGRSLQVVTNSLPIATLFASSRDIDLVLLGGYVYPKTGVALGTMTQQAMRDLHVHRLILSAHGFTERGLFNGNLLLVETQRAMIACADQTMVVADHSKFGRPALVFLCDWSAVDCVIVDQGLRDEHRRMIGAGVEVAVCGDEELSSRGGGGENG